MNRVGRMDEKLIIRVRELASQGLSLTQIGNAMHFSRSWVAGVIRRHGKKHGIELKRTGQGRPRKAPTGVMLLTRIARAATPKRPLASVALDLSPPSPDTECDFAGLTAWTCRYPFGTRAPYTFCGAPKEPHVPYCEYHGKLCSNGANAMSPAAPRYYSW